jgi:hypothetical protein
MWIMLKSQAEWSSFCVTYTSQTASKDNSIQAVEFTQQPERFPCMLSSTMLRFERNDSDQASTISVFCTFFYTEDAVRLLEVDTEDEAELDTEASQELMKQLAAAEADMAPTGLGTLVLALIRELQAIGAIKRLPLLAAYDRMETWLNQHVETHAEDSTRNLLDQVMELPDTV